MTRSAGRHGSRARRRRLDASLVLATLLPLLSVGALLLVDQPEPETRLDRAPTQEPLTSSVAVCPSGAESAFVASGSGASGAVQVRVGGESEAGVEVSPDQVSQVEGGDGPMIVRAESDLAPALLAGRFSSPLASAECGAPLLDEWFTGVGAGAEHTSVLELVNPDTGPAQVDVLAYGADGAIDAPRLRGVPVPAGKVVRLDLAKLTPTPEDLALHVTTARGRVRASLLDRVDPLGGAEPVDDYLPSQDRPATSNLMLGPISGPVADQPTDQDTRTLVVANPGDEQVRANLEVVTPKSLFAPAGAEEIVLAPYAVVAVSLDGVLDTQVKDALGLRLASSAPVTATMRGIVAGDLVTSVPVTEFGQETMSIVATGDKRLLLAGATAPGTVEIEAFDNQGRSVLDRRMEVVTGRGYDVDLPPAAVRVRVAGTDTRISGSVLMSGDGFALQRLRQLLVSGAIASVRP